MPACSCRHSSKGSLGFIFGQSVTYNGHGVIGSIYAISPVLLLTLGNAQTSLALLSLTRSLDIIIICNARMGIEVHDFESIILWMV